MNYHDIIGDVPDVSNKKQGLMKWLFEERCLKKNPDELWLEFGVRHGGTINYFSQFTQDMVYGFDSFHGLPENWRDNFSKGAFSTNGKLPKVRENVRLIKGWFSDTINDFLEETPGVVGFVHLDADIYSSTKCVLDALTAHDRIKPGCIMLFDEIFNYYGYDGPNGELRALYEWTTENPEIKWKWLGMTGVVQREITRPRREQKAEQNAVLQIV